MEKKRMIKLDGFILGLILLCALVLRLYHITSPLSDFHSWRQADTAAVARNFTKYGFDLLHPQYDDLSSIQSGYENPKGARYVEFPLYNAIFAAIYKVAPFVPIEVYGRLVSSIFSLIIIAVIYYLLLKESGRPAAIIASLVYAIFPAFVFFSRLILPETPSVSFAFLAIYFLYRWQPVNHSKTNLLLFILSLFSFSAGVLIKPTVIFYAVALCYIFIKKLGWGSFKKTQVYLYMIISLLPFIAWRMFIKQFPEGIPASDWLITSVNTYAGQKEIFMRPAFFRWIFYERINLMICGGYLTVFLMLGIITRQKTLLFHSILTSSLLYLFVFQGGNVQHEYYQTTILPTIAIFIGLGTSIMLQQPKKIHSAFLYPLVIGLFVLSFSFSYYYKIKDFYNYPQDLNQMAKILDTFTKEDDLVITDRLGDTTLLYLANRKGAPMLYRPLHELKELGYSYYMTDKKEIITELLTNKTYQMLFKNDQFALFKL